MTLLSCEVVIQVTEQNEPRSRMVLMKDSIKRQKNVDSKSDAITIPVQTLNRVA